MRIKYYDEEQIWNQFVNKSPVDLQIDKMYHQERGIFKPSLKSHTLASNGVFKKFAFVQQNIKEDLNSDSFKFAGSGEESSQILDTNNKSSGETQSNNQFGRVLYRQKAGEQNNQNSDSGTSRLTVPKFDPIIPKFIFKRFLDDSEFVKDNIKSVNNQIIQRLQTKNINYPLEVEKLFKEADDSKTQYQKIKNMQKNPEGKPEKAQTNPMEQEAKNNQDKEWIQNSYKQCRKQYIRNEVNKMPYFPLMGTDGSLFWCHSFDKIVLWRYQGQEFYNPDVFCMLSFKHQMAPISAVYVTEVKSSILKKDRAVLISVAFFNQIKLFSFDIMKYEKQYLVHPSHQRTEEDFRKYLEKVPLKVNSNFLIEKILVKNSPNLAPPQNLRPLLIFTDGGTNLEIVDLQNVSAYRTRSGFDFFDSQTRKKQEKSQNQIIKLLVCRDHVNPSVHYAFVLRKQTSLQEVKPLTLIDKLKKLLSFKKQFQQKQNVILTIYEWNEADLRNETLWKKIWNPQRLKKTKVLTSKDLQTKLKQTFYDFYLLNSNNQFIIADISLVQNPQKYSIFNGSSNNPSSLKVTFINGCSIMISNFRSLALSLEVKVNPYIESSLPMTACQYQNYRRLLQKGRHLQGISETKNKFNYLISEALELQKQAKFSLIDPVVSVCNQLSCCQGKLVFQDQHQILYDFQPTNSRKNIFQLKTSLKLQQKAYIIFQNNFMTVVSTPNIAQMFILLGYLSSKYPSSKQQIEQYTSSIFANLAQTKKIHLIESLIYLLVQINSSGKVRSDHLQTKLSFDSLIKKFYGGNDPDETTYLEQRNKVNSQQKNQQTYSYSFNVNRKDYEGFVEYLLGQQISQKQKERLGNAHNSSQNQIQIKITETIFNFMLQILIRKGNKTVQQKSFTKSQNIFETNPNLTNYIEGFLQNENDQMFFIKLFEGMNEINESFLVCSLSSLMLHLLEPVLNLPYIKYREFKSLSTRIVEQIDGLRSFLNKFVLFSSYKDKQSKVFEETVLFLKSLQNSLPKVCLLIRLFQILSEVQYYNLPLQESHKSLWTELTLRNICFKVNTRQILERLTVESLFEENAMLLDEIEEKLPELRNVRNLRFYIGWRKMNNKLMESLQSNSKQEKIKSNSLNRQFSILPRNFVTEFEPQQQQSISKEQRQYFLIEKALNQFSYSDFQIYFIAKRQFVQFCDILLSRISYLQANYLRLKEIHHFNDNIRSELERMPFKESFQNYPFGFKGNQDKLELLTRRQLQPSFKSFLKYEEKTFNYQNFLRTYQLIKHLNQKLVEYIASILETYKNQVNKQANAATSQNQTSKSEWIFFGKPSETNKNQKCLHRESQYQLLSKHIQAIISSIFKKGSEYMKSQVLLSLQKDDVFKVFLNQCKAYHQSHQESKQRTQREFEDLKSRQFLLRDQPIQMKEMSPSQKVEQEQRRMYQQKLKQKFSTELRQHFQVQEPGNWIKKHTKESSLYLY